MIKNHGFIAPESIEPEEYILGGTEVSEEPIMPGGQWNDFLVVKEIQLQYGIETFNCTGYGTTSAIEMLMNKVFGFEPNFSDRYTGTMAGTFPPGNTPHKVIENIRKVAGLIDEELMPFDKELKSVEEYYDNGLADKHWSKGLGWLKKYTIKHKWVFRGGTNNQERLKRALTISPLGVSVLAWQERNGLYYKEEGQQDTHWTVLYGYVEGKYWKIFDSYDNTHKKLEWNYPFGYAKLYVIKKNDLKRNWWDYLLSLIKKHG